LRLFKNLDRDLARSRALQPDGPSIERPLFQHNPKITIARSTRGRVADRNAWTAMPSRYKRRLRSLVAVALACLYMLVAAGVAVSGAHARAQSPCHGHGVFVGGLTSLPDPAVPGPFDSDAAKSHGGGAAGHLDSGCQFCSAIVNHTNMITPRFIVVDIRLQDRATSLFGQSPPRPPRPPQFLLAF